MTKTTSPALDRATQFLQSVKQATEHDKGTAVAFKRALTGESRHFRAVYPFVLRYLEGVQYHQDEWIFVACLFVYYSGNRDTTRNFGESARALTGDSKGPDRRFRALLETPLEDLRSPLTALVRLMKSKNISINYPQLIVDLCNWDHSDQFVQDRWACAFWGANQPPSPPSEESNDVENN